MQPLGFMLLLMTGAGVFVLIYGMQLKARRAERLYQLYEQALQRGLDLRGLNLDLDEKDQGDPQGNLKAGIILLATALSLLLSIWLGRELQGPLRGIGFAILPAGIGLACIFIHYAIPRPKVEPPQSKAD